ncbi:MAG: head-tail connector protein [Methylomonas sp.]
MIDIIKTAPATEPITLAEMRSHLGIAQAEDTTRDTIITGRIISARQWAEEYTRRAFITQTWTAYGSDFPGDRCLIVSGNNGEDSSAIKLRGKLQSVTSVKYLDLNGVQQTLPTTDYLVDLVTNSVVPAYGVTWPTGRIQLNAVQIEYVCGYGNAAAVPEPIKDALRFIVGQWEVFQSSIEGVVRPFTIPNAAKELLNSYIDMRDYI